MAKQAAAAAAVVVDAVPETMGSHLVTAESRPAMSSTAGTPSVAATGDGEITTVQLDIAPFLLHGISHNFGTISIFPSLNHCMVVIYLLLHGRYLLWKCRPNNVVN